MQPFISDNHEYLICEQLYRRFHEDDIMAMHELGSMCRNYPTLVHGLTKNSKVNRCAAARILDMVIDVTLGAGIPFRPIANRLFIHGSTTMFQAGCEMTEKTLNRILNELEELSIIWSKHHHNYTSVYGVSFEHFMDYLSKEFNTLDVTPHCMRTSRHHGALYAWTTLNYKIEAMNDVTRRAEYMRSSPKYYMERIH